MSDDPIARLVAAVEAGPTPGPWRTIANNVVTDNFAVCACSGDDLRESDDPINAAFIAACRAGVPALLARVQEREETIRAIHVLVQDTLNTSSRDVRDWIDDAQDIVEICERALAASGTAGKP